MASSAASPTTSFLTSSSNPRPSPTRKTASASKTVYGATGSISTITHENITLSDISKYGIVIEKAYKNGSTAGTPTTGVPITDLIVPDAAASARSSATDIYVLCGSGSYSSWTWNSVGVTGGKKSTACENIPNGVFMLEPRHCL